MADDCDGAFDLDRGAGFLVAGARQLIVKATGPDFDLRHVAA